MSRFVLVLVLANLVKEHEEAVVLLVDDSTIFDSPLILIRAHASRYSADVHAGVGPAAPAPWVIDREGAELELAAAGPLVNLLEEVKGAGFGEAVQSLQSGNFFLIEDLGAQLDNAVDDDEVKGLVSTGPFSLASVIIVVENFGLYRRCFLRELQHSYYSKADHSRRHYK